MVKNWADTNSCQTNFIPPVICNWRARRKTKWLSCRAASAALWFFVPYLHCCLFFYFCAACGPVLHPCQLSTRFRIFLKPHSLLHQSVFCLHETGESACRDRTWQLLSSPGGGGYSLWWPIQEGSARKGYFFQASGVWKGRDFTCWQTKNIYIYINIMIYKRVGKSVVWVCKRA